MSLEQLLIDIRQRHGYSQRRLAAELRISNTHLGRFESGVSVPSEKQLRRIAEILNVSAQPLLRARRQLAA